jgi:hypothetical protein
MIDPWTQNAKADCNLCKGEGWIAGKEYPDGSIRSSRPCSCAGYIANE